MNITNQSWSLDTTNSSAWLEDQGDDEDTTITSDTINKIITYYGEGILLTAVSTFGLVGNLMSIIVLTRSINSRGCHDNRYVLEWIPK